MSSGKALISLILFLFFIPIYSYFSGYAIGYWSGINSNIMFTAGFKEKLFLVEVVRWSILIVIFFVLILKRK